MPYTISEFKTDATNHLHGTTLNKVPGVNNLIYEAGRNVINQIDPRETKRIGSIGNSLFDQVTSYAVPNDLKGTKIIDIRPQTGIHISDEVFQWYNSEFQQYKDRVQGIFAIQDNSGAKTIQISRRTSGGKTLHTMDGVSYNGTWIPSAAITDLTADQNNKLSGTGSLRFKINTFSTTATLTNSSMKPVDVSSFNSNGSIFMWMYVSKPNAVTNVSLRWGTNSTNYFTQTVTQTHDGLNFMIGWNLIRFDMFGANVTGTPNQTSIGYLRVAIGYDGTEIDTVRLDNIVVREPQIFEIEYYSKFLFRDSSGTWKEKPTEENDLINLDTESYNLLLYEFMHLVAQVVQGEEARFDASFFKEKRDEAWLAYRTNNRGEAKKPQSTYYRPTYTKRR